MLLPDKDEKQMAIRKVFRKIATFGRANPKPDEGNARLVANLKCSKCHKPILGKSGCICSSCFDGNIERLLSQARNARQKLEERLEEATTQIAYLSKDKQVSSREIQEIQAKQLEKIGELDAEINRLLAENTEQRARLSKLYGLISKAYFERFEISALFYIMNQSNLASVLEKGILCKARVSGEMIPYESFADEKIQERRSLTQVGNSYAHNYVPLYFHVKPPMLYRLQKEYQKKSNQNEIIYVCIHKEILTEEGVFFTDRNLAAGNCKLYDRIEDLDQLQWGIIKSESWSNEEQSHIKGAEVLVPNRIDPGWFVKIVVYDEKMKSKLKASLPRTTIPIEVNPHEFYF